MRIAVIGIVIEKNRSAAKEVNEILSAYGDNVIGRMGVPNPEKEVYVISVIFKGSNETISAMTGRLGRIVGVNVKSAVTNVEI
ncbi:MAG: iron-only hydrogenase system regulator [Clostridia bacterium]|nr:iron-only hydrogenase system regulator [Clostridia bacterium]